MLSPSQQKIYDTYLQTKSASATAKRLGLSRSTVREHLKQCARKGYATALANAPVPPGFSVQKSTLQLRPDGSIEKEWRRVTPDQQDLEDWVEALCERVAKKAPPIRPPPAGCESDLLLEIPLPDHHMGMYAWKDETGAAYDCDISKSLLVRGVAAVLADAPKVGKVALIALGDYYHSDNRQGVTEKSGHVLDTDTRFARRVDMGIEALTAAIELAATRAAEVEVIIISGNHDWHSAKWLARVLSAYYRNEKRVVVRTDPRARQYLRHGNVLLGYSHGDTAKARDLPQIMAVEVPELWAATKWRRWREGHWHHRSSLTSKTVSERPGVVVETLPTLAAPDSYAHDYGFLSTRAITAYLWSAKWGLRAHVERSAEEILAF